MARPAVPARTAIASKKKKLRAVGKVETPDRCQPGLAWAVQKTESLDEAKSENVDESSPCIDPEADSLGKRHKVLGRETRILSWSSSVVGFIRTGE